MKICLIDLGNFWKRVWERSGDDSVKHTRSTVIRYVHQLAQQYGHVIVCADSKRSYRKELDPRRAFEGKVCGYKATRPKRTSVERDQMVQCIRELQGEFHVVGQEGYEADDVIAYLAAAWRDDHEVTIAAEDKDLHQCLLRPNMAIVSMKGEDPFTGADALAKHGVPPPLIPEWLALSGDKSDNIFGLDGVAGKRAAWLLTDVIGPERTWMWCCSNTANIPFGEDEDDGNCDARVAHEFIESGGEVPHCDECGAKLIAPTAISEVFRIAREETTRLGGQKVVRERLLEDGAEQRINRNLLLTRLPFNAAVGEDHMGTTREEATWRSLQLEPPLLLRPKERTPLPERKKLAEHAKPFGELTAAAPSEPAPPTPRSVPTPATTSRQMVLAQPAQPMEGIQPVNFDDACRFANMAAESRMFGFGNEAAALAVILQGREMGMGAMTSLRSFHNIKGKASPSAQLLHGLCLKRTDLCQYFHVVEHDDNVCRMVTRRVGGIEVPEKFDMADAKRAGLMGNDNWKKYPRAMLYNRCVALLARKVYPDICMNLYTPDELSTGAFSVIDGELIS